MSAWPGAISAITLFVEDLEAAKRFYREVFDLPLQFEDDSSAVFDFGNTVINLLVTTAAGELIEPAVVAGPESGSRLQPPSRSRTWMRPVRNWPLVASPC